MREREFICHKQRTKIEKNILNITTVAGYQKGIPIKLVVFDTVMGSESDCSVSGLNESNEYSFSSQAC